MTSGSTPTSRKQTDAGELPVALTITFTPDEPEVSAKATCDGLTGEKQESHRVAGAHDRRQVGELRDRHGLEVQAHNKDAEAEACAAGGGRSPIFNHKDREDDHYHVYGRKTIFSSLKVLSNVRLTEQR